MDEKEIRFLLGLRERINFLLQQKQTQLNQIEEEIEILNQELIRINQFISTESFTPADKFLSDFSDAETAAGQNLPENDNIQLSKKIFDEKEHVLLATLQYRDQNIYVRFPSPLLTQITQELYLEHVVKPVLMKLKKIEPDLESKLTRNAKSPSGQPIIDSITLSNVKTYESFEFFSENLEKYLLHKI